MSDIKLAWNNNAMQAVATFDKNAGDMVLDLGLATSVYISLFTDARAKDDDELPDIVQNETWPDRRGWWADETSERENDSIGSRLWLLLRSKATQENVQRAKTYAKEALQWMLDEGVAKEVAVEAERQNEWLCIKVSITRLTGTVESCRFDILWKGTVS